MNQKWSSIVRDLQDCISDNDRLQREVSDLREYIDLLLLEEDLDTPKVSERMDELEERLFPDMDSE